MTKFSDSLTFSGTTNGITPFVKAWGSQLQQGCVQVFNQPCQLFIGALGSIASTAAWLKFYDTANCMTSGIGNGTPVFQMVVPGNTNGAGSNLHFGNLSPMASGLQFTQGVAVFPTLNMALTDTSGAGEVSVALGYR